jgi:hypothetical protein
MELQDKVILADTDIMALAQVILIQEIMGVVAQITVAEVAEVLDQKD